MCFFRVLQWFYSIPEFHSEGGPIFILLGGQTVISETLFPYTLALDLAIDHQAYFVYLEHRFYGSSRRSNESGIDNIPDEYLEYLTVEQAVTDIHKFIKFARNELINEPEAPIILMGWQYAGSLAVWYQHSHPGVVAGVWASSAPLQARVDFPSYLESVGNEIRIVGGNDCYERLEVGIQKAESLYRQGQAAQLEEEFHVCNATGPDNSIVVLTAGLAFQLGDSVQRKRWVHQ